MNDGVKAAIAVCVFIFVIAVALAIFFYKRRKIDKKRAAVKRAAVKRAADEFALEQMDSNGVKPPKYNVAIAEEEVAESSRGNVSGTGAAVPEADPPPYRP